MTKDEKYNINLQEIIALEKGKILPENKVVSPQNTAAQNAFSDYIKQAQKYESQGNIAKANEYYLKAQKHIKNRFEAKFGLAKTYGWLGKKNLHFPIIKDYLRSHPTTRFNKGL